MLSSIRRKFHLGGGRILASARRLLGQGPAGGRVEFTLPFGSALIIEGIWLAEAFCRISIRKVTPACGPPSSSSWQSWFSILAMDLCLRRRVLSGGGWDLSTC